MVNARVLALGICFSNPSSHSRLNMSGGFIGDGNGISQGIELLLEKYRNEFRRPENKEYNAAVDYKEAQRKFVE